MKAAIERARQFTQVNQEAAQAVRELQSSFDGIGDRTVLIQVFAQVTQQAAAAVLKLHTALSELGDHGLVAAVKDSQDVLGAFSASIDKLDALANGEAPGQ